jgi:hypothetical protein
MDEIKLTTEEQKIMNSAKEVSLSMSEKNDIKNNLISYTNTHPVVVPKKTKFFTFGSLYQSGIYLVPAIAAVLLVIGLNTTDNNSGQIASIETIDTNISDSVPAPEAFTTMSAPAGSLESASFAEPKMAEEPSSARMMKSAPAKSAVMMMSASVDTSTTTATSTSKKTSVSRLKDQINETYKSFVNRLKNAGIIDKDKRTLYSYQTGGSTFLESIKNKNTKPNKIHKFSKNTQSIYFPK